MAEAEAECRTGLTIQQKLADVSAPSPTSAAAWRMATTASASCCRARASRRRQKPSTARPAIQQKLADDNPAVTGLRSRVANSHLNLGGLLVKLGRLAEAEVESRKALAMVQKLAGDHPESLEYAHMLGGAARRTWPKPTSRRSGSRRPARDFVRRSLARRRPWPAIQEAPSAGSGWRSI